jgi:predicted metal-binding membrane protein
MTALLGPSDPPVRARILLPALILLAWLAAIGTQLTGTAALLHHHALIEHGPPPWIAVPLFLLGWQVMLAGMMLPASLPTMDTLAGRLRTGSPLRTPIGLLVGFAGLWTAFGLAAFGGDFVLHHIVDAVPWLAARPWLIEGGVLALAGAYQLSPLKRHSLEACRHPGHLVARTAAGTTSIQLGVRHGLDCIGSSWALMLLMFAEGFANLAWMAALTVVMVAEATGRRGQRLAIVVGAALLALSVATLARGFVSG